MHQINYEKHEGSNPSNHHPDGKYACKEGISSHSNYGTDTFTAKKRNTRRNIRVDLNHYDPERDY